MHKLRNMWRRSNHVSSLPDPKCSSSSCNANRWTYTHSFRRTLAPSSEPITSAPSSEPITLAPSNETSTLNPSSEPISAPSSEPVGVTTDAPIECPFKWTNQCPYRCTSYYCTAPTNAPVVAAVNNNSNQSQTLSTGAAVGIALGGFAFFALCISAMFVFCCRNKKSKRTKLMVYLHLLNLFVIHQIQLTRDQLWLRLTTETLIRPLILEQVPKTSNLV